LHLPKSLWHAFIIITCVVDDDRQQEGLVGIHEVRAINRQLPFKTEVPLTTIVRGVRDYREKQGAGLDLLADRLIPGVPAPQLALVEPDFDARRPEGFADTAGRLRVLRGIADENGVTSATQGAQPFSIISSFPLVVSNGRGCLPGWQPAWIQSLGCPLRGGNLA
jgi:hypothetical protein